MKHGRAQRGRRLILPWRAVLGHFAQPLKHQYCRIFTGTPPESHLHKYVGVPWGGRRAGIRIKASAHGILDGRLGACRGSQSRRGEREQWRGSGFTVIMVGGPGGCTKGGQRAGTSRWCPRGRRGRSRCQSPVAAGASEGGGEPTEEQTSLEWREQASSSTRLLRPRSPK